MGVSGWVNWPGGEELPAQPEPAYAEAPPAESEPRRALDPIELARLDRRRRAAGRSRSNRRKHIRRPGRSR